MQRKLDFFSLSDMNLSAVLFEGSFSTPILGQETLVKFKIYNNYEVLAEFSSHDAPYQFLMKKWAKTKEGVQDAEWSFDAFANLAYGKFGPSCDVFGIVKTTTEPDGTRTSKLVQTPEQILNILKYATTEVFQCAEAIITKYRRSLLDYAIHHREQGLHSTYEQYIHLVACHCLVHSKFLAPNVHFPMVDYCMIHRDYRRSALASITRAGEDPQPDEE